MSDVSHLNATLQRIHPAAWHSLSPSGRRLFFPDGVASQAAEARGCALNATIGQLTDDRGAPLPLPVMADALSGLSDGEVFLYPAQGGRRDLREAWKALLAARFPDVSLSLPLVTAGLTNGLAVAAELFVDDETDVLLPSPCWDNYQHIFRTWRGGRIIDYPAMRRDPWRLDIEGLAGKLQQLRRKAVVVINSPGNPTGYTPTIAEAQALCEALQACPVPLVILCDDAYRGMVWEEGLIDDGLFGLLGATLDPERQVVAKIDGATKEMFFFGGRVGFLTFATPPGAAAAIEEKALACTRATISAMPAPSQALVMRALRSPELPAQQASIRQLLRERYMVLRAEIEAHGLSHWPFNSAFFALLDAGDRAESIRRALLAEGIGVVSFPGVGGVRVSYSTTPAEQIPRLVAALARQLA